MFSSSPSLSSLISFIDPLSHQSFPSLAFILPSILLVFFLPLSFSPFCLILASPLFLYLCRIFCYFFILSAALLSSPYASTHPAFPTLNSPAFFPPAWTHFYPEDEDEEDTGEERLPSCFDYVMHFLTVFWKVLFACVPPTDYLNGWACFIVSIGIIGLLTAVIGDLASHFGCTIGLKDSVTAVVFVALGTSVPGETYKSRISTFWKGKNNMSIHSCL